MDPQQQCTTHLLGCQRHLSASSERFAAATGSRCFLVFGSPLANISSSHACHMRPQASLQTMGLRCRSIVVMERNARSTSASALQRRTAPPRAQKGSRACAYAPSCPRDRTRPAGALSRIGQLVAYEANVSRNTLVQLFCRPSSGLIGRGYEYEGTRISWSVLFIGIGVVNEQRTNRAEEL
jgi:hypothetical protein